MNNCARLAEATDDITQSVLSGPRARLLSVVEMAVFFLTYYVMAVPDLLLDRAIYRIMAHATAVSFIFN